MKWLLRARPPACMCHVLPWTCCPAERAKAVWTVCLVRIEENMCETQRLTSRCGPSAPRARDRVSVVSTGGGAAVPVTSMRLGRAL